MAIHQFRLSLFQRLHPFSRSSLRDASVPVRRGCVGVSGPRTRQRSRNRCQKVVIYAYIVWFYSVQMLANIVFVKRRHHRLPKIVIRLTTS